jgi:hypothetical protein
VAIAAALTTGLVALAACNALWGIAALDYGGVGGSTTTLSTTTSPGGAGGSSASGGSSSSGGDAGQGGASCIPECDARECGDNGCQGLCGECASDTESCNKVGECCPTTWAVQLKSLPTAIELWPETQSFFVGEEGAVQRLRTCDGATVPGSSAHSFDSGIQPVALGRMGSVLIVVANASPSSLAFSLDPNSLAVQGTPTSLPASAPSNLIREGAVGAQGTLWLGLDQDGGGLIQYQPGSTPCKHDFQSAAGFIDRGFAVTPTGVAIGIQSTNPSVPVHFVNVDATDCPMTSQCPCSSASTSPDLPLGLSPQAVIVTGNTMVAAGLNGDMANNTTSAEVARVSGGSVQAHWVWDPTAQLDAFFAAALDGSTIYLGGGTNGTAVPSLSGVAFVLSLPLTFSSSTGATVKAEITDGMYVARMAVDEDGVYLLGYAADGVHGFAMKCTKDLVCPAVPAG